jgi:hypothetical protein
VQHSDVVAVGRPGKSRPGKLRPTTPNHRCLFTHMLWVHTTLQFTIGAAAAELRGAATATGRVKASVSMLPCQRVHRSET